MLFVVPCTPVYVRSCSARLTRRRSRQAAECRARRPSRLVLRETDGVTPLATRSAAITGDLLVGVEQHLLPLGCTPAMAAGVTDHLWSMADRVALIEARESLNTGEWETAITKA